VTLAGAAVPSTKPSTGASWKLVSDILCGCNDLMWVDWLAKALDHSGMLRVELDVDERKEGGSRRRWK
jgi:hypothetical protein